MGSPAVVERLSAEVGELIARHEQTRDRLDVARYRGRIVAYAREVHGVTVLTDVQVAHLETAVASPRTAAYGANGCGKTFDDAILALYFIYVEGALVIATSAKESQLRDQFMRDIGRLFRQAPALVGELYTMQLRRSDNPESGLLCMAAGSADNLRSYHAPKVVVQLQEAQGLPDFAFESAEMMAVGADDRVTLTGNSTQVGGPFHRRCLSPHWTGIRFNAEEHPNVIEDRVVIPGGPTRESIAQRAADYGTDSAFFVASVRGLFPTESTEGLTTWGHMERAFLKGELASEESVAALQRRVVLGVDPSLRGTDLNAVCVMQGGFGRALHARRFDNINDAYLWWEHIGEAAVEVYATPRQRKSRRRAKLLGESSARAAFVIDESGLGGPCVDAMKARGHEVTGFLGGASPVNGARFLNLRAEAHFLFRQALEDGAIALPRNPRLAEEAVTTQWTVNASDKVVIESKDDIRSRLGRSPDLLDAVVMALWYTLTSAGKRWGNSPFHV